MRCLPRPRLRPRAEPGIDPRRDRRVPARPHHQRRRNRPYQPGRRLGRGRAGTAGGHDVGAGQTQQPRGCGQAADLRLARQAGRDEKDLRRLAPERIRLVPPRLPAGDKRITSRAAVPPSRFCRQGSSTGGWSCARLSRGWPRSRPCRGGQCPMKRASGVIHGRLGVIAAFVPVPHPFRYVAGHVIQPQPVGFFLPDRVRCGRGVLPVPGE